MKPGESGYIDMTREWQIILHFRDLINIGPMLCMNVDEEIWKFKKKCREANYDDKKIEAFIEKACVHTIYERQMPHRIKDKGNQTEWAQNKGRVSK